MIDEVKIALSYVGDFLIALGIAFIPAIAVTIFVSWMARTDNPISHGGNIIVGLVFGVITWIVCTGLVLWFG